MPPKYEYKTVATNVDGQVENILNSYGKDGWELVSASCMGTLHRFYFKRELRQDPQVDETEDIIPAMDKLKVDAEPPAPTPGVFTFGTPAPTFEKPPDAGTKVEILRRDLDDLRTDFEKVRRKLGNHNNQLITKEEEFEDLKRPGDFRGWAGSRHGGHYAASFVGMTSKDYRAWKGDFEAYHRQEQKNRETQRENERSSGRPSLEDEQIAKDRLEAELRRVLTIEREAEKMAKLRSYNEAEAEAKAQKEHFSKTGEFFSKSDNL